MNANPDPRPPLALRPREAARMLGVSERFLWHLTKSGSMPSVRMGTGKRRTVRYPLKAIAKWLDDNATHEAQSKEETQR